MKKNKVAEEQVAWSNLPKDLLIEIISRLTLKESTSVSAVCKNWYSVVVSERRWYKSPLLLKFPNSPGDDIFELYDPSTRKRNYIELPELRDCWTFGGNLGVWLLNFHKYTSEVFWLNPYTQFRINLPSFRLCGHRVTVSSSRLSFDTTVFALKTIPPTTVAVSRCNISTMQWRTNYCRSPERSSSSNWLKIVYSNGLLYCKSVSGYIYMLDTGSLKWIPNGVPPPRLPPLDGEDTRRTYMLEHRGDIFVIYLCRYRESIVFRLNKGNQKLEKINNLGGLSFFVSRWSALAKVNISGIKVNNIYLPNVRYYGQQCVRYAFDDGRYFPKKTFSISEEEGLWINPPSDDSSLSERKVI